MAHDANAPYLDYIGQIRNNRIASKVKLADLHHNSDFERFGKVDAKALQRAEKYKEAILILSQK